jgi:hypothetical protein
MIKLGDCNYEEQIIALRKKCIDRFNEQIEGVKVRAEQDTQKIIAQAEIQCQHIKQAADNQLRELSLQRHLEQCLLEFERLKSSLTMDPGFLALRDDYELADLLDLIPSRRSDDLPIMSHQLIQSQHLATFAPSGHSWGFDDFDAVLVGESKWGDEADAVEHDSDNEFERVEGRAEEWGAIPTESADQTQTHGKTKKQKIEGRPARSRRNYTASEPVPGKQPHALAAAPKRIKPSWEYVLVEEGSSRTRGVGGDGAVVISGKRTRKKKSYEEYE